MQNPTAANKSLSNGYVPLRKNYWYFKENMHEQLAFKVTLWEQSNLGKQNFLKRAIIFKQEKYYAFSETVHTQKSFQLLELL